MIAKIFVILLLVLSISSIIVRIVIVDNTFIYIAIGLLIAAWLAKSQFNVIFFDRS